MFDGWGEEFPDVHVEAVDLHAGRDVAAVRCPTSPPPACCPGATYLAQFWLKLSLVALRIYSRLRRLGASCHNHAFSCASPAVPGLGLRSKVATGSRLSLRPVEGARAGVMQCS